MIYEAALGFALQNIATIPLQHNDKRPEASLLPFGSWEHYKTSLPEANELARWFTTDWYNYGVIAGWQNLAVLDFDDMDQYRAWRIWLAGNGSDNIKMRFPNTLKVQTHRGMHVYFRLAHKTGLSNRKFPGIDLKINGYVVGPGSVHPSGDIYTPVLSKNNFITTINHLSDILPANILQHVQDAPVPVITPQVDVVTNADPWAVINSPGKQTDDLVSMIRHNFKIEDLLPNTIHSSHDGRWRKAVCPFHDDKSPSLWIDTRRLICNCYTCSFPKPMDVIDLYAALYGMDNRTAIYALAAKL